MIGERSAPQGFDDLNDLVLQLKGVVLPRDLRSQRDADVEELEMYDQEIRRVRDLLADLVSAVEAIGGEVDRRSASAVTALASRASLASIAG